MGWNQSGNFNNAKIHLEAQGSRWRQHRFGSKWNTIHILILGDSLKQDFKMTHLSTVCLGSRCLKHFWLNICICTKITADLYIWVIVKVFACAQSKRPFPKLFMNLCQHSPCLILFGHNPDPLHSWSGTGDVDGVTHSHMHQCAVYCDPEQPTNKNNDT